MKFLFVDTYYSGFLSDFRKNQPGLGEKSYQQQKQSLIKACFGTSDYYSYNLEKMGHKAEDLIINDEILQRKWAEENELKVEGSGLWAKLQTLPLIHRVIGRPDWMQKIALAQIKKYKPNVVYVQDLSSLSPDTLREVKKYCTLLVGQIACPLPAVENLKEFQLILTSFPHYVERFRTMGIKSEYLKIAFEPRVLDRIGKQEKKYDIVFIGSFTYYHKEGTKLFERVAQKVPIDFWGYGAGGLQNTSPIKKKYHGGAWGLDMYKILAQAKIVINRHISAAEDNANNMRLYESTGMGAMLITDEKKNLNSLFKVGKEVVIYKNENDLIKKVKYYLAHSKEREAIASAGQKRTLSEHNYQNRMKDLIKIITHYI